MDAAVVVVLSELDGVFALKEKQRTTLKTSLQLVLASVPTVFGKSLRVRVWGSDMQQMSHQ